MSATFGQKGLFTALAAVLIGPGAAGAATMTFDGISEAEYVDTWFEDGILAVGDGRIGAFDVEDTAHLDDGGSDYAFQITFTMDRSFDARSVDIIPTNSSYVKCTEDLECEPLAFDNVKVNGFRDGEMVALAAFDMFAVDNTYLFGPEFRDLDALRIGFSRPFIGFYPDGTEVFCGDSPCTHYNVDNVTLAPVPLPAAALLLGGALGGLAWFGRRRRR